MSSSSCSSSSPSRKSKPASPNKAAKQTSTKPRPSSAPSTPIPSPSPSTPLKSRELVPYFSDSDIVTACVLPPAHIKTMKRASKHNANVTNVKSTQENQTSSSIHTADSSSPAKRTPSPAKANVSTSPVRAGAAHSSPSPRRSYPQMPELTKRSEYAGPAFSNSPAPHTLPLPSFLKSSPTSSTYSSPSSSPPPSPVSSTDSTTLSAPSTPTNDRPTDIFAMLARAAQSSPLPAMPSVAMFAPHHIQAATFTAFPYPSPLEHQTQHLKQMLNIPVA